MEHKFDSLMDKIMSSDDVKGVLVSDDAGLCLAARGIAPPSGSGYIHSLGLKALELAEFNNKENETPTLLIETEQNSIYIRKEADYTLAIYK